MGINGSFNAGLAGLNSAQRSLGNSAGTVARNGAGLATAKTTATALVEATGFERQAEAAVSVLRTADETLDSLINLRT